MRLRLGKQASGPPTSGYWEAGDFTTDQTGRRFVCIVTGRPGTWIEDVVANKTNLGLGNVDNTSDVSKPVSLAQAAAISSAQATAIAAIPSNNIISGLAPVQAVAGKTGNISLVKADIGLGNVDNTSDANKPVSTATAAAISAQNGTSVPTVGSFTYDGNGNPLTDPDGNTYTWNADGTPHTQSKGGVTRTFTWNADGTLASVA